MNYKPLKLQLRVLLAGHTVAMVTYFVMERTTTCSPIIGQCFDTLIVASSDKEWLQWPMEILVLETVLSHLKLYLNSFVYHRNIFRSSSKVFGNFRKSSDISENSGEILGNGWGTKTVARTYELYVLENIKWISSRSCVMFFYHRNILMTAFLMILRRFLTTFRRFFKIVKEARRTFPKRFQEFPKISEDVWRFPNIAEHFWGWPENVLMIHQRIFKSTIYIYINLYNKKAIFNYKS